MVIKPGPAFRKPIRAASKSSPDWPEITVLALITFGVFAWSEYRERGTDPQSPYRVGAQQGMKLVQEIWRNQKYPGCSVTPLATKRTGWIFRDGIDRYDFKVDCAARGEQVLGFKRIVKGKVVDCADDERGNG
ncbi:hypothetical protein PRZ48_012410 [Zasmidium cellare]|uniref:DUF4333 domain-containing protein n=1 Tax=Zasmidium cellare TaxID=395010 RepID=A0ABR0E4S2_ZASCE|nr:hypothetical protein PRZ48_012410 [Zasmidium cellare]